MDVYEERELEPLFVEAQATFERIISDSGDVPIDDTYLSRTIEMFEATMSKVRAQALFSGEDLEELNTMSLKVETISSYPFIQFQKFIYHSKFSFKIIF